MTRQVGFSIDIKPLKGVVTEYTKLGFPEEAAIDADNVVFFKSQLTEGVTNVSTRPSVVWDEATYVDAFANLSNTVFNYYEWQNPGLGNTEDSILVVQTGHILRFIHISKTIAGITPGLFGYMIDLEAVKVSGAPYTGNLKCDFTEVKGYLVIVHPYIDPIRLEFTAPNTFTLNQYTLKIRDLEGVDDGLNYITRPNTLSNQHRYNLLNQGWTDSRINSVFTAHTFYPSNADIWWLYKNSSDNFDVNRMVGDSFLNINQPAPKGWFILEAFNQDRSVVSGVPGIPVISSGFYRPTAVATYAGRIWYAGPTAKGFYGKVYFSQTVEKIEQIALCHQANDPTSEEFPDLLDTDGGVIDIEDTGEIHYLEPFAFGLLVIAEQGVWLISGDQATTFKPTAFTVTKLSGIKTQGKYSLVVSNGSPFWWTDEGIYTVVADNIANVNVATVTEDTIKSDYVAIPDAAKRSVSGGFDVLSNTLVWGYRDNDKQKLLLYNTKERTFNYWSIQDTVDTTTGQPFQPHHIIALTSKYHKTTTDGKPSVLPNTWIVPYDVVNNRYTFSWFGDRSVAVDWDNTVNTALEARPFDAFFRVGYRIHGALVRKFQSPYIFIYLNNTENSVLKFTPYWNFYQKNTYPAITATQEIRYNPFFDEYVVIKRRLRIRGRGDSVVFEFANETGKVFDLLGWATKEIIEGDV